MAKPVSDEGSLGLANLLARELWELKGFDGFGNLIHFQEIKLGNTTNYPHEYVMDAISSAIANGAVKIVLEKGL